MLTIKLHLKDERNVSFCEKKTLKIWGHGLLNYKRERNGLECDGLKP
jgi:hypothetical protein